jgi:hypothetical protein
MSEQSGSRREPDDAMARQSLAVSKDAQSVTTEEDADKTAQGSLQGTAAPEAPTRRTSCRRSDLQLRHHCGYERDARSARCHPAKAGLERVSLGGVWPDEHLPRPWRVPAHGRRYTWCAVPKLRFEPRVRVSGSGGESSTLIDLT